MEQESRPKIDVSPAGWRLLGSTAVIFGAVCLVGLVAVVGLKKSDALASVALVLAIAAFVVQIIVSTLQNSASRAAEAATRGLNFETNKVLEQIKSSAAANQEILARQFDTLLDALVKARAETRSKEKSESDESPNFPEAPPADFRNLRVGGRLGPSPEDERIIDLLQSFPGEKEAAPLLKTFADLSGNAIAMIDRYARDEIRSRELGAEHRGQGRRVLWP